MESKFHITIDTEPDCDVKWNRSSPLTFTSITEGIPQLMRPIWDKHSVNPIYFISPEVLEHAPSIEALKREVDKGAIIGTHLHSEYIGPDKTYDNYEGLASYEFPCFAHNKEIEKAKIKNLTEAIIDKIGIHPEWYRAARFGADLDTISSLKELGYKYDSSVTPHIDWSGQNGPDHSNAPEQPYWVAKDDFYKGVSEEESIGIKEFPVTIGGKRLGLNMLPENWLMHNWLRPTHMTVFEQKKLIKSYYKKYDDPTFVMMFHSMEVMINRSPYVRNALMQKDFLRRIDKVLEFYLAFNKV